MSLPSRACALVLLAATLGGCQALGGGGGVMPDSDVGPPPSMKGTVPGQQRSATVDEDGAPLPTTPRRQLALPKTVHGESRSADAGPRRINREDIEGADQGRGGSSGSVAPALTPSGGVGLGGRF